MTRPPQPPTPPEDPCCNLRFQISDPQSPQPPRLRPHRRPGRTRPRLCRIVLRAAGVCRCDARQGQALHPDLARRRAEPPGNVRPQARRAARRSAGRWQPISTNVAGIQICECFPQTGQRMQHAAIVRSMTSPLGEHNLGTHYLLTGYPPTPALEYPAIGSVVAHLDQAERTLPRHIAVPNFGVGGRRDQRQRLSARRHAAVRGRRRSGPAGLPRPRPRLLSRRRRRADRPPPRVSGSGSTASAAAWRQSQAAPAKPFEQAYRLIASPAGQGGVRPVAGNARPRGPATARGRSAKARCSARRLIEAGVPFVTVNYPGWDTHDNLYTRLEGGLHRREVPVGLIPSLDLALSALLDDLSDRGLLDETLVVVMGEFGRTPKLNTQGGRDHWPRVFSVLLAGGGVPGGQVIGSSDATGESPQGPSRHAGRPRRHDLHAARHRPAAPAAHRRRPAGACQPGWAGGEGAGGVGRVRGLRGSGGSRASVPSFEVTWFARLGTLRISTEYGTEYVCVSLLSPPPSWPLDPAPPSSRWR